MTDQTDAPAGLQLVQPDNSTGQWRVCLWAPSGEGKSAGAATAPDPILVVNADRPGAWRWVRSFYPYKDIREARFAGLQTLADVYRYLREHDDIQTVVLDPFQNMYDKIVDQSPLRSDGDPDWNAINKKVLGFLYSLREFDVHVILVAHEKLSDGRKGDGKLYPHLGGPSLINKITAEMDIVAHVEREDPSGDEPARYMAQLTPVRNLVGKESTGVLGERRVLDLTEWFDTIAQGLAPDNSDLPWDEAFEAEKAKGAVELDPEDDPEVETQGLLDEEQQKAA